MQHNKTLQLFIHHSISLIKKVSLITCQACFLTLLLALVTVSKLMSPWMFYASYGMLCLLKIYGYIKRRGKGHLPFTLADCIAVGYALLFSLPTYYSQVITIGFICFSMHVIEDHFHRKNQRPLQENLGKEPPDTTDTTSILDNSPPRTPKIGASRTTPRARDTIDDLFFPTTTDTPAHHNSNEAGRYADDTRNLVRDLNKIF